MSSIAYELWPSAEHLGDMTYDVSAIRDGAAPARIFFSETSTFTVPEPIQFVANVEALRGRDLPVPDPATWPIMSRRMLDVLLSVGAFEHRVLRCTMIDDTVMPADRYDAGGLRRDIVDERFVAVHLTTHVHNAFDWERSEFERDDEEPGRVLAIQKLVFLDVPLPPLFRLAPYPRRLLVSSMAKVALEQAGIKGAVFVPAT